MKELDLGGIIHPIPAETSYYHVDLYRLEKSIQTFETEDDMIVEMNPDYQRGHVWTLDQKIHYIENMLRFKFQPEIRLNFPHYKDTHSKCKNGLKKNVVTCIDGLQRYTAITEFANEKFKVFDNQVGVKDLDCTAFSFKRLHCILKIYEFTDKKELLQFYIDLNAGGTFHTPDEINRVKKMKEGM
ncbi:DUF262 domain-containing protein [Proteus mirabilis]|uniref:DUF262 domain-containing protein n=1 Tax=Proteus mirabilis TaxID=584 RepID=UPI0034D79E7C